MERAKQNALKIVVACGGEEIYNKELLESYSISKSSMQSGIKALLKENTLFEENGKIVFEDVEFKLWVQMLV